MFETAGQNGEAVFVASAASSAGAGGGGSDNGLQSLAVETEMFKDSSPVVDALIYFQRAFC